MKNKLNAIYALIGMAVIWMSLNTHMILGVGDKNKASDAEIDAVVSQLIDRLESLETYTQEALPEVEESDYTTFQETFFMYREKHGPGYTFEWNGDKYSTYFKEELESSQIDNGNLNHNGVWVLNSSDIDDWCKSNYHDECGTCDGSGARTWYADRDGDGLGDYNTSKSSCNEPTTSYSSAMTD